MGAEVFFNRSSGENAEEAFNKAVEQACYDFGHSGYTGTIAEKDSYVLIRLPAGSDPTQYADELLDACDERVNDKWGPAGMFDLGDGEYFFFGVASS